MENITIEFKEETEDDISSGWLVRSGEKYADGLAWEEMLGLIAAMTIKEHNSPCLGWITTKEQHEARRASWLKKDGV